MEKFLGEKDSKIGRNSQEEREQLIQASKRQLLMCKKYFKGHWFEARLLRSRF